MEFYLNIKCNTKLSTVYSRIRKIPNKFNFIPCSDLLQQKNTIYLKQKLIPEIFLLSHVVSWIVLSKHLSFPSPLKLRSHKRIQTFIFVFIFIFCIKQYRRCCLIWHFGTERTDNINQMITLIKQTLWLTDCKKRPNGLESS